MYEVTSAVRSASHADGIPFSDNSAIARQIGDLCGRAVPASIAPKAIQAIGFHKALRTEVKPVLFGDRLERYFVAPTRAINSVASRVASSLRTLVSRAKEIVEVASHRRYSK